MEPLLPTKLSIWLPGGNLVLLVWQWALKISTLERSTLLLILAPVFWLWPRRLMILSNKIWKMLVSSVVVKIVKLSLSLVNIWRLCWMTLLSPLIPLCILFLHLVTWPKMAKHANPWCLTCPTPRICTSLVTHSFAISTLYSTIRTILSLLHSATDASALLQLHQNLWLNLSWSDFTVKRKDYQI